MSSHFSCIGFPVADMDAYWALAGRAATEGTRMPVSGGGALARWSFGQARPASSPPKETGEHNEAQHGPLSTGPEIWAQVGQDGKVRGATPFFATGTPYTIAITGIGEDPDEPLEGWVDGWLEPRQPNEPYSGAFPLRVNLVDFALVRQQITSFPTTRPIEIAALTHEAELYESDTAYLAAPGEMYRLPLASFASTAHASADDAPEFQEATALASGRITQARLLVNPVSEAPYWWFQVSLRGATLDAFADRETLGKDPRPGFIVWGSFWLVGRLL